MVKYFVLTNLSQPEYLEPGNKELPNPRYGDEAHLGDIISDEPGGFLEHRTDPRSGELKASYYTRAVNDGWFVRINEDRAIVDMLGMPDAVLRLYLAACETETAAPKPSKNRKSSSAAEETEISTEDPAEEGITDGTE